MDLWIPGRAHDGPTLLCRICRSKYPGSQLPAFQRHIDDCYSRHEAELDELRPRRPFEGDPELACFAREEGSVYHRRPGTRRRPM